MAKLSAEFAMKDLGSLSYFLGIAVTHNAQGLFLSQSKYAANILDRAGMTDRKYTPTPVATTSKLSASSNAPYADLTLYRAFADADWGGCPDTRCSTSGYCVFLEDNLISWSLKR
ncbi:uncharacterized mitochondrial protein AtMg00810-like [Amaranthus tricolor]|uniref:uncharacterized mitochondrial protein AtMg00810-like n=1 Tax=Amaranthus tricolor TaxID=29722 RepID=UPI002585573B|nr:uncharacterized mitochondrial protein AtMg00810-like [Amaranthus tricolor]